MSEQAAGVGVMAMTTEIVSAYVSQNPMAAAALPAFIRSIHESLAALKQGPAEPVAERREPAVPVRRSVTPDHLICLEDGLKFKSLKRHLSTKYGLSPEAYRSRWGLPKDYPMVASSYAKVRSDLAKASGLGVSDRKARGGRAARAPQPGAKT